MCVQLRCMHVEFAHVIQRQQLLVQRNTMEDQGSSHAITGASSFDIWGLCMHMHNECCCVVASVYIVPGLTKTKHCNM